MRETNNSYAQDYISNKYNKTEFEDETVNVDSLIKKAKKLEKEEKKKNIVYATGATVFVVSVGIFLAL